MGYLKSQCSLSDSQTLKRLILENPDSPLLIFVGEDAFSGEYGYEQADVIKAGVRELTLYRESWLDREDYEEELANDLCDAQECKDLSDLEFEKMIDKKVSETEFVKAITVYVG